MVLPISGDLRLFENDFGVTGTFGTDPDTFEITGMFTAASQGVAMQGNIEVEAMKASFTVASSDAFGTVTRDMPVTIAGQGDFIVGRIEPVGNGYTVLWLKQSHT